MNATDTPGRRLAVNQVVGQSLMIPFAMELDDKLRDSLVENGAILKRTLDPRVAHLGFSSATRPTNWRISARMPRRRVPVDGLPVVVKGAMSVAGRARG
jgi:hypothetical protein